MDKQEGIKIKGIFNFHGLYLPIIGKGKFEFVPLKPLTDLIGMDWKTVKNGLKSEYKANFFHYCLITPPPVAGMGGLKPPPDKLYFAPKDALLFSSN